MGGLTLKEAMAREIGQLWKVVWFPIDCPIAEGPLTSFCVAPDANAAFAHYSHLVGDLRSIERIGNGGIYVPGIDPKDYMNG